MDTKICSVCSEPKPIKTGTKCAACIKKAQRSPKPLVKKLMTEREMEAKTEDMLLDAILSPRPRPKHLQEAAKRVEEMNAQFESAGLQARIALGTDVLPPTWCPSGIPEIDTLTGGFPRGHITELFGPKGAGKTSLMAMLVAKTKAKIFYVDAENGLPNPPASIHLLSENLIEIVEPAVQRAIDSREYDLVVVDSIAALEFASEFENEFGSSNMGQKAKLMHQWRRRVMGSLRRSQTALVFTNQYYESMSPYGPRNYTPGGKAIEFAASLRLEIKSNKADKLPDGQWCHIKIEKSRFQAPGQETKFKLLYPTYGAKK